MTKGEGHLFPRGATVHHMMFLRKGEEKNGESDFQETNRLVRIFAKKKNKRKGGGKKKKKEGHKQWEKY